jgi:glycosyltransferase involved in cell wall biosynthesis
MHIMLVADGRSPTTRRWIATTLKIADRITMVSTFPCAPIEGIEAMYVLPVAFSGLAGSQAGAGAANPTAANQGSRKAISRFRGLFLKGRYLFGPLTLPYYGKKFARMAANINPDLVHALRIPFEGMLARYTPENIPMAVSIWGNDLTLHAAGSGLMPQLTGRVLKRANGLAADTHRDIRLARALGFASDRSTMVVPGSGGIILTEIERIRFNSRDLQTDFLPAGVPLVVNPRGFRPGSVRNDVFFSAIPLVLQRRPDVAFVCPAMAGQPEAIQAAALLPQKNKLHLLPHLPQQHLWDLFVRSTVMASISQHDGTPNTLLEAMACGCFPVAGDIESIREWITPGVNGLLVEPTSPQGTAEAILTALDSPVLRKAAAEQNSRLIQERAEVGLVREKIRAFYQAFLRG